METAVIDALATFRLSRLVTTDTFPPVLAVRNWIWHRFPPDGYWIGLDEWRPAGREGVYRRWLRFPGGFETPIEVAASPVSPAGHADTPHGSAAVDKAHPIGELISCDWCASVWIAAGVVVARRYAPRLWSPVARLLALSAVASILAEKT